MEVPQPVIEEQVEHEPVEEAIEGCGRRAGAMDDDKYRNQRDKCEKTESTLREKAWERQGKNERAG